ncbi:MAG: phosphate acyltransferase PlsX [Clostridiales bacterium]|nr:phosphate acyltransferase PlsX [Clostridiales bacterium]
MKIIVDAMGGDYAPFEIVKGAIMATDDFNVDIILVGRGEEILRSIEKMGMKNIPKGIEIAHTSDVVTMEDDPSTVIREKKDSSLTVALGLLRDGGGDALVSAGNTGALLSGSTLLVKRIRGIRRAALAPVLPEGFGNCIMIDSGANTECTPEYLLQFAYMGTSFAKKVLGKESPRVALLNIGTEESKGPPLQKETYKLLMEAKEKGKLNFIGNIESRNILNQQADVIVSDGFSGNVLLKTMEGTALYFIGAMKDIFRKNALTKLSALLVKKSIRDLKRKMDYSEVGGSVLLGISKPVVKAHGSSEANAIRGAIGQSVKMVASGFVSDITDNIRDMKISTDNDEKNS